MSRTIRHAKLDNPTARSRLKRGRQPHFQSLIAGRAHIAYQRDPDADEGRFLLRRNNGGKYSTQTLGIADDKRRADGVTVLSYEQAKAAALAALEAPRHGRLTVRQAMADYIDYQTSLGKNTNDLERRTVVHILSPLGDLEVAALTTEKLRKWLSALASAPVRRRSSANGRQNYGPAIEGDEAVRRRRSSANRVANYLRAALSHAHVEGKVSNADAWGRRWKRFKNVEQARLRYLSLPEASRFLAGCDPQFRLLARGALETGARYGELCRLVIADLNLDVGTLTIRKSKSARPRTSC